MCSKGFVQPCTGGLTSCTHITSTLGWLRSLSVVFISRNSLPEGSAVVQPLLLHFRASHRIVTHYPLSTPPPFWNPQGRFHDNTTLAICIPAKTASSGWQKVYFHSIWVPMCPRSLYRRTWKNTALKGHVSTGFPWDLFSKQSLSNEFPPL